MTTSTLGMIVIVIVVAAGLVVWITAVFRAEKHPETGRVETGRRRKIVGGSFRGDPRQQMPRRDAPAEVISGDTESSQDDRGEL